MTDFIHLKSPSVTVTLVASTSNRTALPASNVGNVRVYWDGSAPVYMIDGDSTVTASLAAGSLTSFLAPGSTELFSIDTNSTHIAGISTSAGTLYIQQTTGE